MQRGKEPCFNSPLLITLSWIAQPFISYHHGKQNPGQINHTEDKTGMLKSGESGITSIWSLFRVLNVRRGLEWNEGRLIRKKHEKRNDVPERRNRASSSFLSPLKSAFVKRTIL